MCSSGWSLRVIAVLRTAVRRNVRAEGRLPFRRELGKLEAEAAVATITTTAAAAVTGTIWRPDARDVLRLERQIRIVDLRISRPLARSVGRRLRRGGGCENGRESQCGRGHGD